MVKRIVAFLDFASEPKNSDWEVCGSQGTFLRRLVYYFLGYGAVYSGTRRSSRLRWDAGTLEPSYTSSRRHVVTVNIKIGITFSNSKTVCPCNVYCEVGRGFLNAIYTHFMLQSNNPFLEPDMRSVSTSIQQSNAGRGMYSFIDSVISLREMNS